MRERQEIFNAQCSIFNIQLWILKLNWFLWQIKFIILKTGSLSIAAE